MRFYYELLLANIVPPNTNYHPTTYVHPWTYTYLYSHVHIITHTCMNVLNAEGPKCFYSWIRGGVSGFGTASWVPSDYQLPAHPMTKWSHTYPIYTIARIPTVNLPPIMVIVLRLDEWGVMSADIGWLSVINTGGFASWKGWQISGNYHFSGACVKRVHEQNPLCSYFN